MTSTEHDHSHGPGPPVTDDPYGSHGGHDKHAGHDPEMFRRLFWWNLLLAIPVIVFSRDGPGLVRLLDRRRLGRVGRRPCSGTVIYLWGGKPFLVGGVAEVRDRQPGMMLLIALAITVAYGSSLATSLGWGDLDFWWELAALIVDHAARPLAGDEGDRAGPGRAGGAGRAAARPRRAGRATTNRSRSRSPTSAVGDVVLVRPGGRVPADGEIVDGQRRLDESMITGESRPVERGEGDRVVAGTVSTDSGDPGAGRRRRRRHRAGRHPADGRRRAELAVADAGARRSGCGALFYVATAAAVVTVDRLDAVGRRAERGDPHRHGAGHRLPARARAWRSRW